MDERNFLEELLPGIIENVMNMNKCNKQSRFLCYKAAAEGLGYKMRQKLPQSIELAIKYAFPDIANSYVMYKES